VTTFPRSPRAWPTSTGPAAPRSGAESRGVTALRAVEAHERQLFARLLDGLADIPVVRLYGAPGQRTPTALFSVAGVAKGEVSKERSRRGSA
jgi:selenocysteine lyase/cysteine desulfurase